MIKKLLLSLLVAMPVLASALPVDPRPRTVVLADGSTKTVTFVGDEHGCWAVDADGKALREDTGTGHFVYMSDAELTKEKLSRQSHAKKFQRRSAPDFKRNGYPTIGERHALVLLVEFQDKKFESVADPKQYYTRQLNELNFGDNGAIGSARDFYILASDSLFIPTFDVVGPLPLPHSMAYYGANEGFSSDARIGRIGYDAAVVADSLGLVDFTQYDLDQNGWVDNIFIYYAGYGEADSGMKDCVWPHSTDLSQLEDFEPLVLQGMHIGSYACSNELRYNSDLTKKIPTGIGTFVHEFGHTLGLPDLYSTVYNPLVHHPNTWSTMASGSYNENMNVPPTFSAYERYSLGWIEPKVLTTDADSTLTLLPLTEKADAYMVMAPGCDSEFFMYENRQPYLWDSSLPSHGMLIWHIDVDEDVWARNSVNNDFSHQYIDVVEADGIADLSSMAGDTFPGSTGITEKQLFAWDGTPIAQSPCFVSESIMPESGQDDKDIDVISFLMLNPSFTVPQPDINVIATAAHSIDISWAPVKAATSYEVSYVPAGNDGNGEARSVQFDSETLQASLTDLIANTAYSISVTACVGYSTSEPATVTATTSALPFHELRPENVTTSNVTANGFCAEWTAVADATGYSLLLFTMGYGSENKTIAYDFTEKGEGLPAGWETSSTTYYSVSGYYGASSPSIRFSKDQDFLLLSYPESKVKGLTFWSRAQKAQGQIMVQYLDDNSEWQDAEALDLTAEATTFSVSLAEPQNTIRLLYMRDGGYVCIDDVKAELISLEREFVNDFNCDIKVAADGGRMTANVTGLKPATQYGYTVTALADDVCSLPSAEQQLCTLEASDETQVADPVFAYAYSHNDVIGFEEPTVYNIAVAIDNNSDITRNIDVESKQIKSVLIYPLSCENMSNVKVWVANKLPENLETDIISQADVDVSKLIAGQFNEIALPETCTGACYVGYTFTITKAEEDCDKRPIPLSTAVNVRSEGVAWIADTDGSQLSWFDYTEYFGSVVLGVRMEGEFASNGAMLASVADSRGVAGENTLVNATILNLGVSPLASVDYTISGDSQMHYDLTGTQTFGILEPLVLEVPFTAPSEYGLHTVDFALNSVNGTAVSSSEPVSFDVVSLTKNISKRIVEEEFTGTSCGNCPRGMKAMEITEERYPDAILVAIHTYVNYDPMYLQYPYSANAFPACFIDRAEEIDPYYGFADLSQASPKVYYGMDKYFNVDTDYADMGVTLDAAWNETNSAVDVTATTSVAGIVEKGKYRLEFVIVADSLHGNGGFWNQVNYLSGNTLYSDEPYLSEFVTAPYNMRDVKYNHVALKWFGGSNENVLSDTSIGTENVLNISLDFSDTKYFTNASDYGYDVNNTSLVAFIIKDDGTKRGAIVNAAKVHLSPSHDDAIAEITSGAPANRSNAAYNLSGQRINPSLSGKGVKGIIIVDGKKVNISR